MKNIAVIFAVLVASHLSLASSVERNRGPYWESGIILAKPVKVSHKGVFLKTWEAQVQIGEFDDNTKYIGTAWSMSISESAPELVEQFQKLDSNKSYLFHYVKHFAMVWTPEKSSYIISKIEDVPARQALSAYRLPPVKTIPGRKGTYGDGGSRTGRIISVERWGHKPRCAFELALGGIVAGKSTDINAIALWAGTEEACRLAETLMKLRLDVKVDYVETSTAFLDRYTYIARSMTPVLHPEIVSNPVKAADLGLTHAELDRIKAALINDPQFMEQIRKALESRR